MAESKFNTPNDTPHAKAAATAEAVATASPLVGTWQACNKATRGIVRVEISEVAGVLHVHVFGACSPTPCDWGDVKGLAYATGLLDAGSLLVENYNTFKDGSGRANYYDRGYFCKR